MMDQTLAYCIVACLKPLSNKIILQNQNSIVDKIGRFAYEEVVLKLIQGKCQPVLLTLVRVRLDSPPYLSPEVMGAEPPAESWSGGINSGIFVKSIYKSTHFEGTTDGIFIVRQLQEQAQKRPKRIWLNADSFMH
jgi:hypothetical protein